jgi:formate/nitrite transporter FocA (FNT family)
MINTDTNKECLNLSFSGILAGFCISIGCIVNLMVGCGIPGAVLFTFGLITVVHYKYALYTGTAGFVENISDIGKLFWFIFANNFLGCLLTAVIATYAIPDLIDKANVVIEARSHVDIWQAMIRGIFCGFLMTTAVKFARENKWLPLLFAVPVFILAGFYHSIADAFYLCASNIHSPQILYNYLMIILGNFIGCNLYRLKFME